MQEDIINSILDGKDTLALLPTGGGKSICFQIPALAQEGVCIVVSPLIALMKDQVQNLKARSIKATALYSGMRKQEIDIALDNCIYGDTKFLYLSPERLASTLFVERFKKMNINFIAVDEAHCISQWGYDFRPAYLKINELRNIKPELSILALTATATPEVVIDIQEKLEFKTQNLLQKSFYRSNLSYSVLYENAKHKKLLDILQKVKGSAIVYVQNRRGTKEISDLLNHNFIKANYYHAGLSNDERDKRQQNWIKNKTRVIVATNAFGMGIDKPNVRVVIHLTLADSLEAYFQEAGRAGRDGKKAYAVLLYNESDKIRKQSILKDTMPSIDEIKEVYEKLGIFFQLAIGSGKEKSFNFDISEFCNKTNLNVLKVYTSLKFLEYDEYLILSEAINQPSKVLIKCDKKILSEFIKRNKNYDIFFKTMLRTYGGMFEGFAKIKENFLAQKLNKTLQQIKDSLAFLEKQNIIIYQKQNNNPFIYFLKERLEINNLLLNTKNIKQRIKIFNTKHKEMLKYGEQKNKCRSNALLEYFGEKNNILCGICDVCLGRNKLNISKTEQEKIIALIKNELFENSKALSVIEKNIKINNLEKLYETIRFLMDNGFVYRLHNGELIWKR